MENVAIPTPAGAMAYEYAVAGRALGGERLSGDASLVHATPGGVLVAVVDGLGHGEEAAAASGAAINILREYADEPLIALLQRCHESLQQTRGAAVTLAALDTASSTLTWTGVGNVEAVLVAARRSPRREKIWLTNHGGVVGFRMPVLQTRVAPLLPGDLLIIATDGIDERFVSDELPPGTPQHLARTILDRHGKASDDALVLVLRWRGRNTNTSLEELDER